MAQGSLFAPDELSKRPESSDCVTVYRFDDGWTICRVVDVEVLRPFLGSKTDFLMVGWNEAMGNGKIAPFLVRDAQGRIKHWFGWIDINDVNPAWPVWLRQSVWGSWTGDPEQRAAFIAHLLPFMEDMITSDPVIGSFGGQINLPLWLPDIVWDRITALAPSVEAQIASAVARYNKHIAKKDVASLNGAGAVEAAQVDMQRTAFEYVQQVFKDIDAKTEVSAHDEYAGVNVLFGSYIEMFITIYLTTHEPDGPYVAQWRIDDSVEDTRAYGATLIEAWNNVGFETLGWLMRESAYATWYNDNTVPGTPVYDIEPYLLLDETSPLLYSQDQFLQWLSAQEPT